jgi:hypothetical protein
MSDKVDETNGTPPVKAPTRTLKLKGPRIERPPAAKPSLPAKPAPSMTPPLATSHEARPNFLTRIDQIKRQMQADMDALANPEVPSKKKP